MEVPRRDEENAEAEKICEDAMRWNPFSGGTGVERVTRACGRGNVPIVKSVRSRKRERSETSEPSVNWSSKSSELERNWFRSSSGSLVLMGLSNATNSARETVFAFSRNVLLAWRLITSSERQVVLALEVPKSE